MPTLKELQDKRGELATKIREMAKEFNANGQNWPDAEQEGAWRQVNADYDANMALIEAEDAKAEQAAQVANRLVGLDEWDNRVHRLPMQNGAVPPVHRFEHGDHRDMERQRTLALAAWCRGQFGRGISDEMREAAEVTGIDPRDRELRYRCMSTRSLQQLYAKWRDIHPRLRNPADFYNAPMSTSDTEGGDLIPPETLIRSLEVNLLAYGGMREVAEIRVTASGETLSWPTFDDTANSGRLIAESTAADDNAGGGDPGDGGPNPATDVVSWGAYKFTSDTVLVPYELLEDSVFDLPAVLGEALAVRIARITNAYYTTGTGSSQPTGIVTASELGVTTASATAIAADEVYDLQHSVDPAYRNGARFMCHDNIVLALRKLKSATEELYIWQSGFNTGVPDTLCGAPFTVNQSMASSLTATYKVLLYGQLNKYKIRRVNQIRIYRLEEKYRNTDQDGFVAFIREDGNLLNAGTCPVKYMQMHA